MKSKRSPPPERIILGLDPGYALVGYAFIRKIGNTLVLLACGVIRTSAHMPLEDRLLSIYQQLHELLVLYRPTEAAVEDIFFGNNRKTAMLVGQARGVLLLALKQHDLPVASYTPAAVKLAVTGSGNAHKTQVGRMVQTLLKLPAIPRPDDAADAAAVALCHAHMATWHTHGKGNNQKQ